MRLPGPKEPCGLGSGFVGDNLPTAQEGGILATLFAEIPFGGAEQGFLEIPNGLPLEQVKSLVDGEIELRGLVEGVRIRAVGPIAPRMRDEGFDQLGDGAVAGQARAEVEGRTER